jgi:hypothetical protein
MIDIIIFSKDRACQLDALIRSLNIKFKIEHTLLYKYYINIQMKILS